MSNVPYSRDAVLQPVRVNFDLSIYPRAVRGDTHRSLSCSSTPHVCLYPKRYLLILVRPTTVQLWHALTQECSPSSGVSRRLILDLLEPFWTLALTLLYSPGAVRRSYSLTYVVWSMAIFECLDIVVPRVVSTDNRPRMVLTVVGTLGGVTDKEAVGEPGIYNLKPRESWPTHQRWCKVKHIALAPASTRTL